jgi:hypothetical protein
MSGAKAKAKLSPGTDRAKAEGERAAKELPVAQLVPEQRAMVEVCPRHLPEVPQMTIGHPAIVYIP